MGPTRKATRQDYVRLQGGEPGIREEGGLFHIVHGYRSDKPEVVTHISPEKRGTVIIGGVEFEVAKLWQFEGKPCETQSRNDGGRGYDRKG